MGEPTRDQRIATWVTLAILVVLLVVILVHGPCFVILTRTSRLHPPQRSPYPKFLPLSELRKIATAEVKKREGWLGEADAPNQEGVRFYFTMKSKARGERIVVVEGTEGMVLQYRR